MQKLLQYLWQISKVFPRLDLSVQHTSILEANWKQNWTKLNNRGPTRLPATPDKIRVEGTKIQIQTIMNSKNYVLNLILKAIVQNLRTELLSSTPKTRSKVHIARTFGLLRKHCITSISNSRVFHLFYERSWYWTASMRMWCNCWKLFDFPN